MCPLRMNKPELCKAALSSLMIDRAQCVNGAYVECAIYAIESQRSTDNKSLGALQKAEGEIINTVEVGSHCFATQTKGT